MQLRLGNIQLAPPREGDRWIIPAFEELGYSKNEIDILNRVRLHQEVIFESDVFCADGRQIEPRYLRLRGDSEKWSEMIFPIQKIPPSHLRLWRSALSQLAPGGRRPRNIGKFTSKGHREWSWKYNQDTDRLYFSDSGWMEAIEYVREESNSRRSRQSRYIPNRTELGDVDGNFCSVIELEGDTVKILSHIAPPPQADHPDNFLEVLKEWGCLWLWKELKITNSSGQGVSSRLRDNGDWIRRAIEDKSLMGVTDGSYIRELCPQLCSAALILECQQGRGRLVLTLGERCLHANAYRGELLGLMALHLLLLSFNKTWPELEGQVEIYSDCLGALHKVENLPPGKIPSKCRHSDILKNIMLHCNSLSFKRIFSHVKAHQDDHEDFDVLAREAQLNSGCDYGAKSKLMDMALEDLPPQQPFPLEPLSLFVDGHKLTSESGKTIRFYAHRDEARNVFAERSVLQPEAFDLVDWPNVHATLHSTPALFRVFACKQVFDEAATFRNLHKRKDAAVSSPICPFCTLQEETTGHILLCPEEARVQLLKKYSESLMSWLLEKELPRDLVYLIIAFIQRRGEDSMENIGHNLPTEYLPFARAQDSIGWRRFLEGMVAAELIKLIDGELNGGKKGSDGQSIVRGLVQKLLEITHGMWIFRNLMLHDSTGGIFACERKDRLRDDIEEQLAMGEEGLKEEDKWLLEVELDDLDGDTMGEKEAYARESFRLRRNTTTSSRHSRGPQGRRDISIHRTDT